MPLCYGGGVKSVEQIERIVSLGVEKVALSSPYLRRTGNWSQTRRSAWVAKASWPLWMSENLVLVIRTIYTHNGKQSTGCQPGMLARRIEELGAGEVVINSIDRDGLMKGYDLDLVSQVRKATTLPLTVLGGAG